MTAWEQVDLISPRKSLTPLQKSVKVFTNKAAKMLLVLGNVRDSQL
jgi:hypothetical protein